MPLNVDYLKSNFLEYKENGKEHKVYEELNIDNKNLEKFIKVLNIELVDINYQEQKNNLINLIMQQFNCTETDAENFYYGNAINEIIKLATQKDITQRKTKRHESRRIDNQLRGRSGRQGDPGESRFYIGLDDDLMKIFVGNVITKVYNTLGASEDMPIESRVISKAVENAQKKVEGRNFSIRKNVLQYDDVMNKQREIIYKQRRDVLDGENLKDNRHC